jgi:ubiquinone/menaquinone biosynthesis C-methylase UbiE
VELQEAIELINDPEINLPEKRLWYDLGAGTGTFTVALAHLLGSGSKIIAIDENSSSLRKIPPEINHTKIETITQDFTTSELPHSDFDGILMANSFHYVKNKFRLIEKISKHLKQDHHFLIIEYDTEKSNQWVPYPLSFVSLRSIFTELGYHTIRKLHEKKSRYNSGKMYAALISSFGENRN